jgi:hypothetical protein
MQFLVAAVTDERLLAGEGWQDTGLVFATHLGAALDAANVRKMFKRVCRRRRSETAGRHMSYALHS